MAVVIRAPPRGSIGEIVIPKKSTSSSHFRTPYWTGIERTNTRIKSQLKRMNTKSDCTKDFLAETLTGITNTDTRRRNVVGVRCPEPLGIVTFEDVIDSILQKTSRDERDFYSDALPRTKARKPRNYCTISTVREESHEKTIIPAYVPDTHLSVLKPKENSILRKRNTSNKENVLATMDGAYERSADTEVDIQVKKNRKDYMESSYTQNSRGGFHDTDSISSSIQHAVVMTLEELAALGGGPLRTPVNSDSSTKTETVSLPSRKATSPFRPGDWNPYTRRYVSAMPVLPGLRRVTPFSRQEYSSYEKLSEGEAEKNELVMPSPSMVQVANPLYPQFDDNAFGMELNLVNPLYRQIAGNASSIDINESFEFNRMPDIPRTRESLKEDTGDTIFESSITYGDPFDIDNLNAHVYSRSSVESTLANIRDGRLHMPTNQPAANHQQGVAETPLTVPYQGFPPELLDQAKENHVPDFLSNTMPRIMGFNRGFDGADDQHGSETHPRESSFHDDRALLPSQRRVLNSNSGGMDLSGLRRTSFWF